MDNKYTYLDEENTPEGGGVLSEDEYDRRLGEISSGVGKNFNSILNTDKNNITDIKNLIQSVSETNLPLFDIIKLRNSIISLGIDGVPYLLSTFPKNDNENEVLPYLLNVFFVIGQINIPSREFGENDIPYLDLNKDFIDALCQGIINKNHNVFIIKIVEQFKEKLYQNIGGHFNGEDIRKIYKQLKVPGNNLKVKNHPFGSIIKISSDYIGFSKRGKNIGLTPDNIPKFDENDELQNDTYRIWWDINNLKQKEQKIDFNLGEYAERFLFFFFQYYNNSQKEAINRSIKICNNIFGIEKGTKISEILISFITKINNAHHNEADFMEKYKKEKDSGGTLVNKYTYKLKNILDHIQYNEIVDTRKEIKISSYLEILNNEHFNIFNKKYISKNALMLQSSHSPEMINAINNDINMIHSPEIISSISQDMSIDITKLTLQSQIYLINFLWDQSLEKFEDFKQALNNIENKQDKYNFLNTFLACSKTPEIGDKIIELAKQNGSENIFKGYASLVDLQSVEGLTDELRNILSVGEGLLIDSYEKSKNMTEGESLECREKYGKDFLQAGLLFKKMKDKNVDSLEDLEKVGIEYKKLLLSEMTNSKKSKIQEELMSLYKENYNGKTQAKFLQEIEDGFEKVMSCKEDVEFNMYYINGKPILSNYFKKDENGEFYLGAMNAKNNFQQYTFGFWVLNKLLEEKKGKIIYGKVFNEIEGEETERYKLLLKAYKSFGFKIDGQGESKNTKFYTLTNDPT